MVGRWGQVNHDHPDIRPVPFCCEAGTVSAAAAASQQCQAEPWRDGEIHFPEHWGGVGSDSSEGRTAPAKHVFGSVEGVWSQCRKPVSLRRKELEIGHLISQL